MISVEVLLLGDSLRFLCCAYRAGFIRWRQLDELVAGAPLSHDVLGAGAVATKLLSKVLDVHFELVGGGVVIGTPDVVQKYLVGNNLPRLLHQMEEDAELNGGKSNVLPGQPYLPGFKVDGEITTDKRAGDGVFSTAADPAHDCMSAGQELNVAEGLGNIVVRACFKTLRVPAP